jgi:diadenosine tetraphosphate (Ap4A) HIT family hydrolase
MSHVYQPVMLIELLRSGGSCTEEQIARSLLSYDSSQVEYYEKITLNMVGRVLRSHRIISRDRRTKTYELTDFDQLSPEEVRDLIAACETKLEAFLELRGDAPWSHRKKSLGYVSGTLRYEVLKTARFRCELCGISAEEKALEVDHIVPRNLGGSDDVSNLQALCYSCNAMKRDRDDTDFRAVRASYDLRERDCLLCEIPPERIVSENELAYVVEDAYPVTEGHSLIVTKRHVASLFDLGRPEINACMRLLAGTRQRIEQTDSSVRAFNVGVNVGLESGQTIFHCHWHLIPRRAGDVEDPRGGVRNTIPGKGAY